jgi:inner membrane protein involved in colicin E2 resistance
LEDLVLKRITAIAFIFVCTTIAWAILGGTIFSRTYSDQNQRISGAVATNWGTAQTQVPPSALYYVERAKTDLHLEDGKPISRQVTEQVAHALPLERSRVEVALNLGHRQKGLLWYSTYAVNFSGLYTYRNTSDEQQNVTFTLDFPAAQAIYDDLIVLLDGKAVNISTGAGKASTTASIAGGQSVVLTFGYRSQGLDSWNYKFIESAADSRVSQVKDFNLSMHTNFKAIDFPQNTLSPTEKHETSAGWDLTWNYKNLLSGLQIGMAMPEKLQPGPLAGEISFFAPVSLFFFFFLMFILTALRDIDLHPMNYFFLATAFFAFHLLLAYLVDHISIHWAFVICSVVSVFLVVSYLRLVVGMRFAAVEAGGAQLLYLVLFSYAFFFKGFTGLAITIGSILTLFAVMQITGRINWREKFAAMGALGKWR